MIVNVVMGGPSAEHEISLKTGLEVTAHLDRKKYSVGCVVISRDKNFYYSDTDKKIPGENDLKNPETSPLFSGPFSPCSSQRIWSDCDIAFLALHGAFGEDGTFQGFLETLGLPYTGSGVLSSALCMDKILSKQIFAENGIETPPFEILYTPAPEKKSLFAGKKTGYPCFVKCPQSGSSRLMGRAVDEQSLLELVSSLGRSCGRLLIEKSVTGREFSCAVISGPDGALKALPPILIKPAKSHYFDYEAKYTQDACEEIVPAPCGKELTEKIQKTALTAHKILNCSSISRTDMIECGGKLYVLELNSLPGMTKTSLIPKAWSAAGGSYEELIETIIQSSLKKME